MNNSYTILADYYDLISANDCNYPKWSQYLLDVSKRYGAKKAVDIACGTGKMTALLEKHGLQLIGVDSSEQMLSAARQKGLRATLVRQDMRKLTLPRPVDMAVAVNDAVNYLKPCELAPFFSTVAQNLRSGAPFVFDVSSPYKLNSVVGNNVFYYDDDDCTLLWTNDCNAERVKMQLALFTRNGEAYDRNDEAHTQYIHTREAIQSALAKSGFELIEVTADYGDKLAADSLRLTFLAVKGAKEE